jgi:hypothetical protein
MEQTEPITASEVHPSIPANDSPRREPNSVEYLLGQLELSKSRSARWKRMWMREVMRSGRAGEDADPIIYTGIEMDYAEGEAVFWDVENDGRGNLLLERQS